jgi:signal transduction histidine kinase
MLHESVEKRSEFRFPVVVPVEYFKPQDSGIMSYSLDLSKSGTFISSDEPIDTGSTFGLNLTIPFDDESSKIFRTEGMVVWNKIQPFKSIKNGMGVQLVDPLPETFLLNALANNVRKLIKEIEAKRRLEQRVEKLESELEESRRLASLGRYVEKILFDLSNPILALSGKLEIIKNKMYAHKRMLEERKDADKDELKNIIREFDTYCKKIDTILKDYKVISDLAHIVGDDSKTLEKKLQKYTC